ncbi:MAG: 23S rRNA (pseudouridine(1915)-N(3))-methyltransferase RlmH [Dysgonamonadaceae bacterium]|jgi:23S rRNA (pseudouridine1915-N3)-methyltransferase|nr:23S rRNA (pseudouridine(1915)-N(3))-methyltransferase RlmH [Dysgonamonadaceae bacterium]
MKIQLLVSGKTTQDFVKEGLDEYCARLKHYFPFEMKVVPELKNAGNLSFEQQKEKEGELLLKNFQPDDFVALLDERGSSFTSLKFAGWIEKKQASARRLVFVVGGPYGFSEKVYQRANEKISLSKMTFSHQIVRLLFIEQLYRAATILNNEPYHHE